MSDEEDLPVRWFLCGVDAKGNRHAIDFAHVKRMRMAQGVMLVTFTDKETFREDGLVPESVKKVFEHDAIAFVAGIA